jgi:protein-tyrosine phosphatase
MFRWGLSAAPEIFWIEGDPPPGIAIVVRPRGEEQLEEDLRGFKRGGIDILVSLLEPREAEWLGLAGEHAMAEWVGLEFLSFPIPDGQVPPSTNGFPAFVTALAERLKAGRRIGIHCQGSIGRATVTAACTLVHLGWQAHDALEAIAVARGYAVPDTLEQEDWILAYRVKP